MYRMYRRWHGMGIGFGFPPFGFWLRGGYFPRREEYIRMLQQYKEELEQELKEVNRELADLAGSTGSAGKTEENGEMRENLGD